MLFEKRVSFVAGKLLQCFLECFTTKLDFIKVCHSCSMLVLFESGIRSCLVKNSIGYNSCCLRNGLIEMDKRASDSKIGICTLEFEGSKWPILIFLTEKLVCIVAAKNKKFVILVVACLRLKEWSSPIKTGVLSLLCLQ